VNSSDNYFVGGFRWLVEAHASVRGLLGVGKLPFV